MRKIREYRTRRSGRFQTPEEQLLTPDMTPRIIEGSIGGDHAVLSGPTVRTDDFKHFPASIEELNSLFAEWGASFSHMWNFDETSGNVLDYGNNDQVTVAPLVPNNSPTQNVSTGLVNGDKGVQTSDGLTAGFQPAGAGTLDVTTDSVMMIGTCRILSMPAATRGVVGKVNASSTGYYINVLTSGQLRFSVKDAVATTTHATVAVDHTGTSYFDFLAIVSRLEDGQTLTTNLGDSGIQSPPTDSLTNATQFSVSAMSGITTSPAMIFTFLAWGTSPGTLVTNRSAALQRYRNLRT